MTEERKPVLGAYGVTYQYADDRVLDEVSFELWHGEVLALLGPNGCGKSTLMKLITGILPLSRNGCSAQVLFRGENFFSLEPQWRARSLAYVAPDIQAEFPLTAYEAVMLGRSCHGSGLFQTLSPQDRDLVRQAMERCFCWNLRDRDLHTLSGGERQLVALARALAQGAKVLFLDESMSRMDLNHQASVGKLLRELAQESWSVVLVSHDVNLASEWADSALLLKKGRRIAYGPVKEVLTDRNIQTLYPGSDLVIGANPDTGAPKIFFGRGK